MCKTKYTGKQNYLDTDVNLIPENIAVKSPLTMLNAAWGVGKTHFLNSLLTSIKQNNLKPKIIKKYVYIDSWKYCSSNNIINDFVIELGKSLTIGKSNKLLSTKKIIKNIINYIIVPSINSKLRISLPSIKDEKNIKKISDNITVPTLVIIDNIERLGHNAWEIIRVIQKLSISRNLVFLLSVNKEKFNKLCGMEEDSKNEWNLEKYINMSFYNLKPNYKNLLKSYNISDKYIEDIDRILKTNYHNELSRANNFLNVRELERLLIKFGFKKDKNVYSKNKYLLLSIFKKIWNPSFYHNGNKLRYLIETTIYNDLIEFSKNYMRELFEINNKNILYFNNEDWVIKFKEPFFTNDYKYWFISKEFKNYLSYFIKKLENIDNPNDKDINNDIIKIKKILNDIESDPDLVTINQAMENVYSELFNNYDLKNQPDKFIENVVLKLSNITI